MTLQDTTLNTSFDSGASLQRFDNPLSVQALPLRSVSSFAIASGGMFTDNASSNFAGVASNPFDDARVCANGAVMIDEYVKEKYKISMNFEVFVPSHRASILSFQEGISIVRLRLHIIK